MIEQGAVDRDERELRATGPQAEAERSVVLVVGECKTGVGAVDAVVTLAACPGHQLGQPVART